MKGAAANIDLTWTEIHVVASFYRAKKGVVAPCPPLRASMLLLHISVIRTLSLNFSITKSRNLLKLSQQGTNKNYQ